VLNTRNPRQVYVPALIWRTLSEFSSDSVVVVLASEKFDKDGYYRDKLKWRQSFEGS
jgi:hypothetical protein